MLSHKVLSIRKLHLWESFKFPVFQEEGDETDDVRGEGKGIKRINLNKAECQNTQIPGRLIHFGPACSNSSNAEYNVQAPVNHSCMIGCDQ